MCDIKLRVSTPMLADYLAWLFPPASPGGPLLVRCGNSVGRVLVAHAREDDRKADLRGEAVPERVTKPKAGDGEAAPKKRRPRPKSVVVDLLLPDNMATRPLDGKWLWYPPADTAAVNMALRAAFDLDFGLYYLQGEIEGFRKMDIVHAFIISRGLVSEDCYDTLHKRVYRRSLKAVASRTGQLLNKIHYIDSSINLKGLKDD